MDIRELERNKFYYGKLLTVSDFEVEQQYFIQKAKLLNRIMFSSGVVSGLQVTKISETKIAVESGIALDYEGNMIVLPVPQTLVLSDVSGYLYENQREDNYYLCLRFKEKDKDVVQSTNCHVTTEFGDVTYNRVIESCEFYLQQNMTKEDFFSKRSKQTKKTRVENYFKQSLSDMTKQDGHNSICIAKVHINREEKIETNTMKYSITKVDLVPFGQYVFNQELVKNLVSMNDSMEKGMRKSNFSVTSRVKELSPSDRHKIDVTYDKEEGNFDFELGIPKKSQSEAELVTGVLDIELNNGILMQHYVSREIDHGLGKGSVYIDLSIEDTNVVFFGDSDVFSKSEEGIDLTGYTLGSVLYQDRGTFKIGIKYHNAREGDVIRVRWWCLKSNSGN